MYNVGCAKETIFIFFHISHIPSVAPTANLAARNRKSRSSVIFLLLQRKFPVLISENPVFPAFK